MVLFENLTNKGSKNYVLKMRKIKQTGWQAIYQELKSWIIVQGRSIVVLISK
jgi:hypothetical protein